MNDSYKKQTILRHMFWSLLPAQIMTSLAGSLGQIINSLIVGNALPSEAFAANVVEHGFTKGKQGKQYLVEAFAMVDGENVTLSIRDNAPAFDPKEKLAMHTLSPEHPEKNMGIRMVEKIADRMVYQSTSI